MPALFPLFQGKTSAVKRLLLLTLLLTGCQATPRGGVTHVVVFWLKDHGNAAQRAKIIETSESFRKIPGVLSVKAGQCLASQRPIVDSSFDVALTMEFASKAAMRRYLDDPRHKAGTVAVLKPLVRKITAYDFVRK